MLGGDAIDGLAVALLPKAKGRKSCRGVSRRSKTSASQVTQKVQREISTTPNKDSPIYFQSGVSRSDIGSCERGAFCVKGEVLCDFEDSLRVEVKHGSEHEGSFCD